MLHDATIARKRAFGGSLETIAVGMLLPTLFIVAAPPFLIFILPLTCILLVFGLVLGSGRWPSRRDIA